jgi:GNAT superfamily N-acetyltransferase
MHPDLPSLVRRLERAQALQSRSFLLAVQRRDPAGRARALKGRWGFAHFFAEGHFLNQALALGLDGPVAARQWDRIEALLGQGGHPVVLELAPTADPGLSALLAGRGYGIQAFQQVLLRELAPRSDSPLASWDSRVSVRRIGSEEMDLWCRVVQAGFQDSDELESAEATASSFSSDAEGNGFFLATVEGRPAGAGVLGCFERVGVCSGTSVLPAFRGLGVQRALLAVRLKAAREEGCRWGCAAVLPGTASQENLERCGFRVVYPKVEMIKN